MTPDAQVTRCRWCLQEIIPCTAMPVPACKGWKHVRFLDTMPIGAHYCGGRGIYPSAEPELPAVAGMS